MLLKTIGVGAAALVGWQAYSFAQAKKASSINEDLTVEDLRNTIFKEAEKYGLDIIIPNFLSNSGALAHYDFDKDIVVWSAGVSLVIEQASLLGLSYQEFIRIVLAHEAGHRATPDIESKASKLSSLFITSSHVDLEEQAWKHGRKFIKQHGVGLRLKYELFNVINITTYKNQVVF